MSGLTIEPSTTLEPTFSSGVYNYTAWYDLAAEFEEAGSVLTVTAVPTDESTTIEIIGQRYSSSQGYYDYGTVENGGTFNPTTYTRLVIKCAKDGRTAQYIVNVRMYEL